MKLSIETGCVARQGAAGAVVGRIAGELFITPRIPDLARSDLNIFVAGSRDAILMVEGDANEVPEEEVLDAILFAHRSLEPVLALQEKMAGRWSKPRIAFEKKGPGEEDLRRISEVGESDLRAAYKILAKQDRRKRIEEIAEAVRNAFPEEERLEKASLIAGAFKELEKKIVRGKILSEKRRIDGRGLTDIRALTCPDRRLPRAHGSAIFPRGETQVLVTSTLGTSQDEQRIDSLLGASTKTFMLHYNFPPFSVGEGKRLV